MICINLPENVVHGLVLILKTVPTYVPPKEYWLCSCTFPLLQNPIDYVPAASLFTLALISSCSIFPFQQHMCPIELWVEKDLPEPWVTFLGSGHTLGTYPFCIDS